MAAAVLLHHTFKESLTQLAWACVLQGRKVAEQQHSGVQVTVRQQDGQEQQMLLETPVPSSFAREQLQEVYGPGLLLREGDNAVVSPAWELQPAERYIYNVSAGGLARSL
jgi:hypothetical protein